MTDLGSPDWVEHPDLVKFYATERRLPEDVYDSEQRFLPWLASAANSILDVGCGSGGFAKIWRQYNPEIQYTGVDASKSLIESARQLHPEAEFRQADGAGKLPFADSSFDVVSALGWLHLEPRYRAALVELWRVTRGRLFFDLRLQDRSPSDEIGEQRLSLATAWDGKTTIPYIAATWSQVTQALTALQPARILAFGYEGAPADTVDRMLESICFATFVLERGEVTDGAEIASDLPLTWPDEFAGRVRLLTDNDALP